MSSQLSGVVGTVQSTATSLISRFQSWIDSIIPPEKRAMLLAKFQQFAGERPFLTAFLASWLTFSGIPLGIYIAFCVTVALFALIVGLLLALLATVAFILTMAGFALMVLFPTLFFTTFCAVTVFGWGVGLWFLVKWTGKDKVLQDVGQQVKGFLGSETTEKSGESEVHGSGAAGTRSSGQSDSFSNGDSEKPVKRHPGHKVKSGSRLQEKIDVSQVESADPVGKVVG